jgi:hypothetical protein
MLGTMLIGLAAARSTRGFMAVGAVVLLVVVVVLIWNLVP